MNHIGVEPVPYSDSGYRGDQLVAELLMVSLPMIVRGELAEGTEEPTLPEEHQAVETLLSNRVHKAFRVGIGNRRPDGHQHNAHHGAVDDAADGVGPFTVAIADEDAVAQRNRSIASVSRRAASAMNQASGVGVEPAA